MNLAALQGKSNVCVRLSLHMDNPVSLITIISYLGHMSTQSTVERDRKTERSHEQILFVFYQILIFYS